jgi:exopolyphosphatase / guanosine-5'-triphosphate,3'-diphosphate pyrophosphatase
MVDNKHIAVLDIGSNSFHLVIATVFDDSVDIIKTAKHKVRLVDGLSPDLELSSSAIERGREALLSIANLLNSYDIDLVRIVATHTLRKSINAEKFQEMASTVLPFPVEIISGEEEARLIFRGVSQTTKLNGQTLIIDIGGGSTEFVIGERQQPKIARSIEIGCVSFTSRYFYNGQMTAPQFDAAIDYAKQQLAEIEQEYIQQGWDTCLGTSGSVESVLTAAALRKSVNNSANKNSPAHASNDQSASSNNDEPFGLCLQDLYDLKAYCLATKKLDDLDIGAQNEDRKHVFAGGVTILIAIFETLGVESMQFATTALREGVIYDMLPDLY